MVNGSACLNSSQLVGTEDGTSHVPVGDWLDHLQLFYRDRSFNTSGTIKSSQRALILDLHVNAKLMLAGLIRNIPVSYS